MISLMPHTFRTGETLDPERINDSLLAAEVDVSDVLDQRFTYSQAAYDIGAVTQADTDDLRSIFLQLPPGIALQVVGVEFIFYESTGAVPWTITPSITGLLPATATPTAIDTRTVAMSRGVGNLANLGGLGVTLSAPSASTISGGRIIVHFRGDRGANAANYRSYKPIQLNAGSADTAAVLDATLDNIGTSVADSAAATTDLRVHSYSKRNIPAGTYEWRLPSTGARFISLHTWLCASAGSVNWIVRNEAAAGAVAQYTVGNAAAGTGSTDYNSASSVVTQSLNNPLTFADDWTVELVVTGGVELAYAVLYSS